VEVKQREVNMFADIVEDVKLFLMPKKEELLALLDRILIEDKRREFTESHKDEINILRT